MGRVGSGWGDFLTQPTMVGQKKIQPNPTHHISPTQPNPHGSGWTHGLDNICRVRNTPVGWDKAKTFKKSAKRKLRNQQSKS